MSYPQLLISDIIQIAVLSVLVVQAFLINKTLKADHERRRKQATLEYINAVSERYKSALNEFNKRHGEDRFVDLSDYTEEDKFLVKSYLNEIENICTGVNCEVLDYYILKRMTAGNLKRNHSRFSQYIEAVQRNKPTTYTEYDAVVARLKHEAKDVSDRQGKIQFSRKNNN